MLISIVRKHPVVSFFVIAYGLSWAYWIPLAIARVHVSPGSRVTHFPGLLGPALAAFIVTGLTDGMRGILGLFSPGGGVEGEAVRSGGVRCQN